MTTHRWISLAGCQMTAIDVKAYQSQKRRQSIKRNLSLMLSRLITPNSAVSLLLALSIAPVAYHAKV